MYSIQTTDQGRRSFHLSGVPRRLTLLADSLTEKVEEHPNLSTLKAIQVKSEELDDRIGHMELLIEEAKTEPTIRRIAASVLKKKKSDGSWEVGERDWKGEVVALFDYVRENVRYTLDIAEVELFQRPERTLELGIGDCDDETMLLAALLRNVGYPVALKAIGLRGNDYYQHVYLIVGIPPENPSTWMALDPSRPEEPGWELPASEVGLTMIYDIGEEASY